MVVGARHSFQFFRQKTWFLENNRALSKYLYGVSHYLKLVSAIFYQIFIFPSSDRPSKSMKNVFYFILKALFVVEIFNFL